MKKLKEIKLIKSNKNLKLNSKLKPIIATSISGLFIKNDPWKKAHLLWFNEREKELIMQKKDTSIIKKWKIEYKKNQSKESKNYFNYVDKIMIELYPEMSDKERTTKARDLFFKSVLTYIELYPEVMNNEIIRYFYSIKNKYRIALITTNSQSSIHQILSITKLINLFDIIESSLPEEKDNKNLVFNRFIKKYNKPLLYIGGDNISSFEYCKNKKISAVYSNLENTDAIKGVKSFNNLLELEEIIDNL